MASKKSGGSLHNAAVGGSRYKMMEVVGSGSFGDVYLGIEVNSGEEVAIKTERADAKPPQLPHETIVIRALQGGEGMPVLRWSGRERGYRLMVMDLLGPNLEDLFNLCGRRFSLRTILLLADQMLRRIEFIHSRGILHCDIKPENFLMGMGDQSTTVYLVDFGLARPYINQTTGKHVSYGENRKIPGTARYASINAHLGREQSRRDDLESLGYVLVYFSKGSLPWQGIKTGPRRQRYELIAERKIATPLERLCDQLPTEFLLFLTYCRGLNFDEQPDYRHLRQMLRNLARNCTFPDEGFDWNDLP